MPILGIIASSITGGLSTTAYASIATTTLTTTTASVTFSSIPATYMHLQVRAILKDADTGTGATNITMRLNGDTASNYDRHYLRGTGSAADAGGGGSDSSFTVGTAVQNGTGLASMFGAMIVDILDYSSTNKYKAMRTLTGQNSNGAGTTGIWLQSGFWANTNAITSITISSPTSMTQYSSFALYGIKGA